MEDTTLADKADSYVCGISDTPLLGDTIGRSLDLAVRRWGSREALVSPSHGVRWTWTEFAERVDALAAGFLALGRERGARSGIWSLSRPKDVKASYLRQLGWKWLLGITPITV